MSKRPLFFYEKGGENNLLKSCLKGAMDAGPALQDVLLMPFHSNMLRTPISAISLWHEVTYEYFRHRCPGFP